MKTQEPAEHPALAASKRSWSAVHRKAKEEWLALFAEEATVEDPVGATLLDPEGRGHRGKKEISAFWDANIEPNTVKVEMRESYPAGNEVAHVGTITTTLGKGSPFGEGGCVKVEGVFTYKIDDSGKLVSLRGFWDFDKAIQGITPAPES
jgi:ketosteroid isomerase-like protein